MNYYVISCAGSVKVNGAEIGIIKLAQISAFAFAQISLRKA